jgi:hypothetical protein
MPAPNGTAYLGTVVSGGPGSSYQVSITGVGTVAVTQVYIDPTETIPAGTSVVVVVSAGAYFMQSPVFAPGG